MHPQVTDVMTWHYVFCMGMYRAFYLLNWIWRYMTQVKDAFHYVAFHTPSRSGWASLSCLAILKGTYCAHRMVIATGLSGLLALSRPFSTLTFSITISSASLMGKMCPYLNRVDLTSQISYYFCDQRHDCARNGGVLPRIHPGTWRMPIGMLSFTFPNTW